MLAFWVSDSLSDNCALNLSVRGVRHSRATILTRWAIWHVDLGTSRPPHRLPADADVAGTGRAAMTATSPETIHITDDSTKAEVAEAITHLAEYAARQQHHPDSTRWVRAHEKINRLLTDYENAPA